MVDNDDLAMIAQVDAARNIRIRMLPMRNASATCTLVSRISRCLSY
jgi:hypothetical protein